MRARAVWGTGGRYLVVAGISVVVVGVTMQSASASCEVVLEPLELVTGRLAGEPVEEQFHVNLGQVLGVAELETVRVWDAIPDYTAASATVVTRYWGVRPPVDRFNLDDRFDAQIHGGHRIDSYDDTSCDPSVALALGSRHYVAVFEVSSFVPVESGLTSEQEAILRQFLGAPTIVDPPLLPAEHPAASSTGPLAWILLTVGVVALGGVVVWRVMRHRSAATPILPGDE